MSGNPEPTHDLLAERLPALQLDLDDPDVARARASVAAKLLGTTAPPLRIGRFVVLDRIGTGGMGIVYSAYDPLLDRKVAIKLLFAHRATARERSRLVDEAKSMAKLAHPHVVHVYEVGEHAGQVFVAMELVRGRTLRQWCRDAPRTVRETLMVCLQAGEGLAAAHAAGIVHRDFKPDNVLVGEDGRARVLDFGLARALVDPTESDDAPAVEVLGGLQQTSGTGVRMGTPGYVAPEQLRGDAADRLSDQFAFCITVWEALAGVRPFAGHASGELLEAIDRGAIGPVARDKLPTWIERVLRRGLADAKDEPQRGRWSSVAELLHALTRDPARVRRRRAAFIAVSIAIAGAFALGVSTRSQVDDDPCNRGEETIAAAWPPAERKAARARIVAIGAAYGDAIAPRLAREAADYAERWSAIHRDACTAHRAGEQSAELLDRRMMCLRRAKSAFATLGRLTADVDATGLADLVSASNSLPDLAACDDLEALAESGDAVSPDLLPLVERLAEAQMLDDAGDYDAAGRVAAALVADARAAGDQRLLAQALRQQGYQHAQRNEDGLAAPLLKEATTLALAADDDDTALEAWGLGARAMAVAGSGSRTVEFGGEELMIAIADRRTPSHAAALFYRSLGSIAIARGHREQARAHLRHALEMRELIRGRDDPWTVETLGIATDDAQERSQLLARAKDAWAELLGPEHPRTLDARLFWATDIADPHVALSELRAVCRDYETYHPTELGDVRECLEQLILLFDTVGDERGATETIAAWAEVAEGNDAIRAKARLALARGRPEEAERLLVELVERSRAKRPSDAPFWMDMRIGADEVQLGLAWRMLDDPRAEATLNDALRRIENAVRDDPRPIVQRQLEAARRAVNGGAAHDG